MTREEFEHVLQQYPGNFKEEIDRQATLRAEGDVVLPEQRYVSVCMSVYVYRCLRKSERPFL